MTQELTSLSKEQRDALKPLNVSDSIRYLDTEGFQRAEIARILGKRYQHVRNVLVRSTKSGARRKTLAFSVLEKNFKEFETQSKSLGYLPEKYLGEVLAQGLDLLRQMEPNSPETEEFLIEHYRSDYEPFSDTTVSIKLESPLVAKIQTRCKKMHVPLDFFVTAALDTANVAMSKALECTTQPFEFCTEIGYDFLSEFVKTEEEVEAMQAWRVDDEHLIEAVAEVKKVPVSAAAHSVVKLSRGEKEKMKTNPQIQPIMKRLKSCEDAEVTLDDLL